MTRSTQKDKWTCRIVDTSGLSSARGAGGHALLFAETRPSPREHHPGTLLRLPTRAGGGGICEAFVLRTRLDYVRGEQTTFVHRLDGAGEQVGAAAGKIMASMTPREVWQVLINLCCGSSVFALEALLAVSSMRAVVARESV